MEIPSEEPEIPEFFSSITDCGATNRIELTESEIMAIESERNGRVSEEMTIDIASTNVPRVDVKRSDIEAKENSSDTNTDIIDSNKFDEPEINKKDSADETKSNNGDKQVSEVNNDNQDEKETQRFFYNWTAAPKVLYTAAEEYNSQDGNENFTKGCQWSPDGTCLMVPADDFRIRIYELPRELYSGCVSEETAMQDLKSALSVREGGTVYDCRWYPFMNSWDPATCCFLSTSRESPLHLWDAFTGELRATYRPYNQVDEVEAAISVEFIDDGREVWCGFKGALRSFDTERPGRQKNTITLKKEFPNVNGLVSCIRENPIMPGLIAFGTYSKCVGLYKDGPLCSLRTHSGVTQIEFSPCGMKLYTAVRRNNEFLCWDLRNPGVVLFSLQERVANTNQRIQFALSNDGSEIISGGTDGFVKIWKPRETASDEEEISPLSSIKISNDCINGVNMHKSLPILATTSGQRICDDENEKIRDNSVRLWHLQNQ